MDGGPDPLMATRALDAHLPFWDRSLDLVVATHPDEDHLRGLIEVVKRHKVDTVLEGIPDDSALYLEWRQALDEEALEVKPLYRGQTIDLGGPVRLEVLNPSPEPIQGASSDGNNNSVVLRLTYGAVSFLLTADIEEGTEIALLQERGYLGSTVLKVPHHGSRTSTSPAFLETVSPRVAVIQAGADNPHGHPHQEVVRRLEDAVGQGRLYTTARHGTVELITDGVSLWVKTER
ncbi:MAG: MBL fold metallo-hydrolase [Chloroflexi bacterium]|nr:MBL fold metallo-hydrolase [Chloroflexota bacterium]